MSTGDFFELAAENDSVVNVGVFDGVHRGHRHLLQQAVDRARELGCLAVVVTFDPRPQDVLRPELASPYLATLEERIQLLGEPGFGYVVVLNFTREVAAMPAEEFVRILRKRYRMIELWVGPHFALGRGRGGTTPVLRELGGQLGFRVQVVEPFRLEGQPVSSTLVRQRLAEGDVVAVASLLGRMPSATGRVVAGAGRGRTLSLPTANVTLPEKLALPADGVYAVRCRLVGGAAASLAPGSPDSSLRPSVPGHTSSRRLAGVMLAGVANVGIRPTFDGGKRTLEVHLLDFCEDIYGAQLRVEFIQRLRPELRFSTVQELLNQVQKDIQATRAALGYR